MFGKTSRSIFLAIILVTVVALFLKKGTPVLYRKFPDEFFRNQKELEKMVQNEGIYKTYAFFEKNFATYDASTKHYLGHFLGERAYQILGDKGFDVCNFGLDYGCIHGFVIAGITEKGPGYIETVMNRCFLIDKEDLKRGSCIHGVSHTILSLKGYKFDDVKRSLNKCNELLKDDPYEEPDACYSAIFMEFNLMSLDGQKTGNWFQTRVLDKGKPLFPCDVLDVRYHKSCYGEMASLWSNNIGDDFDQMSSYCNMVTILQSRKDCFWGIGRTMADLFSFDYNKVRSECSRLTKSDTYSSCIIGASIVLTNNGIKDAKVLCDTLTGNDKDFCQMMFRQNSP